MSNEIIIPDTYKARIRLLAEKSEKTEAELTTEYLDYFKWNLEQDDRFTDAGKHLICMQKIQNDNTGSKMPARESGRYDFVPIVATYPKMNRKEKLGGWLYGFVRPSGTKDMSYSRIYASGEGHKLCLKVIEEQLNETFYIFNEIALSSGDDGSYFYDEVEGVKVFKRISKKSFEGLLNKLQHCTIADAGNHPSARLTFTNNNGENIEYTDASDLRVIRGSVKFSGVKNRDDGTQYGFYIISDLSSDEITVDEDGNVQTETLSGWCQANLAKRFPINSICDFVGPIKISSEGRASMDLLGIIPFYVAPPAEEDQ